MIWAFIIGGAFGLLMGVADCMADKEEERNRW